MTLPSDFIESLKYLHPKQILEQLRSEDRPKGSQCWSFTNEIKPVDLYCYFKARFGPPNGIQNFLREDTSDNLVHWNWTFSYGAGLVDIQGTNYRTDVWLIGPLGLSLVDREDFLKSVKDDFAKFGVEIKKCRNSLEHWIEFVNPYQRIRRAVLQLSDELRSLELDQLSELSNVLDEEDRESALRYWDEAARKFNRGFGLCFGIRSMLPIMAEAFINLILYLLMRTEIKTDTRLKENAFKQPIDVRVKSLSINCRGFKHPIDYSNPACGRYHSVVNERNDLLHGNVNIGKLKFNEIYFHGTVPIFKQYRSMWQRSLGVEGQAVGLDKVSEELAIIDDFITYVLSCIDDKLRPNIEYMLSRLELGLNTREDRLGVLFSERLVDSMAGPASDESV